MHIYAISEVMLNYIFIFEESNEMTVKQVDKVNYYGMWNFVLPTQRLFSDTAERDLFHCTLNISDRT